MVTALCAACQSEGTAQPEARGGPPFAIAEVAKFSAPWAMAFLPGSGLPLTNMALLTEKEGRLWLVDVTNGKRTAVSGVPDVVVAGQGVLADGLRGGPVVQDAAVAEHDRPVRSGASRGPEFVQDEATPEALADALLPLLNADSPARRAMNNSPSACWNRGSSSGPQRSFRSRSSGAM